MFEILDKMFIKRFCLPSDTNVETYETGENTVDSCLCGNYNHVACILQGKDRYLNKKSIICFGINIMGDVDGNEPGIHAEHNALLKLMPLKYKRHLCNIDLLVIRISKQNKLQCSKPCNNCIQLMKKIPEKKGYKIQNVYYSDGNGNIVKTNLNKLERQEKHYSRFYRNIYNMYDFDTQ